MHHGVKLMFTSIHADVVACLRSRLGGALTLSPLHVGVLPRYSCICRVPKVMMPLHQWFGKSSTMITGAADCSATQYLSDIASAADNCITVHSTYVTVNPNNDFLVHSALHPGTVKPLFRVIPRVGCQHATPAPPFMLT